MCVAKTHVRFAPNSDRKSGFPHNVMSALPPKADICAATGNICFAPDSDRKCGHVPRLFDHLVSRGEQRLRNADAERFCSLEIDNQIVFGRRLHWHIAWFLTPENTIDISRGSTDRLVRIWPINNQAAVYRVIA